MGCTNHSDGDGMVACDGNEIPRPIPSHTITIPFVMVIPSHRITTHRPENYNMPIDIHLWKQVLEGLVTYSKVKRINRG